jgi:fumarate reductase iron-sulfur subunit
MSESLQVSIWRGGADGDYQSFEVPAKANQTVLDVVTWVQRHADATLAYRFACRVGMCGSCAMMVNGEPRWTCRSHVSSVIRDGELKLAPLANLPVIRDLTVDMTTFFDKWQRAEGRFHPSKTRHDEVSAIKPDTPARKMADEAVECINCGVCYAACDTVRWNTDYLGPAALNRAWTLVNDERDAGGKERLAAVSGTGGCYNCHSHQSCQVFCPKALNPTRSIAGLKRAGLKRERLAVKP